MEQVEGLYETFISSGWLQQQCDNFNAQNEPLGYNRIPLHDRLDLACTTEPGF